METSIFRDTLVYTLLIKVKLLIREHNIHKQTKKSLISAGYHRKIKIIK